MGYTIALLVNLAMLLVINAWPGWEALPFLTGETTEVLGWVNASLVVTMLAQGVLLWRDPRWHKALSDLVTTTVGFFAVVQVWQVFPFEFDEHPWVTLVRVLLILAMVGSGFAILVSSASLVRNLISDTD
jgi:hypothetical protein